MKKELHPGRNRKSVVLLDNIRYSTVQDKSGKPLDLYLSLMLQHGNVEARLANGLKPDGSQDGAPKPVILWIPGGGYRGADKNLMVPEAKYLADAGYAVASMYYRGSGEQVFPAQIIDVRTAIRFLRANAAKYNLDPLHIAAMGRSAGGHLAALAGMNLTGYDTGEWQDYSSEVQAVCDMFGPVDVPYCLDKEAEAMENNPHYRWKTLEETHPGALIGGDPATMRERSKEASPTYLIGKSSKIAPMLIMHGGIDRHVPAAVSEKFYNALTEAGYGAQTDYYFIPEADHGSDEFFQPETQEVILDFFDRTLRK